MPSVYPALDGDTTGDAWQRVQDVANGLHLHVHAVHSVHGEGGPAHVIRLDAMSSYWLHLLLLPLDGASHIKCTLFI